MDRDFLIDLFAEFGPVTLRRMFSGFGISADGTNFALALRGGLYLRADDQTIPRFEAEGSKPFQYQTRAKTVTVGSYWQLPERLYDDPEELTGWARRPWRRRSAQPWASVRRHARPQRLQRLQPGRSLQPLRKRPQRKRRQRKRKPHPEERAFARVSKDGNAHHPKTPRFETRKMRSSP